MTIAVDLGRKATKQTNKGADQTVQAGLRLCYRQTPEDRVFSRHGPYDVTSGSEITPYIKIDTYLVTLANGTNKYVAYIWQNVSIFTPKTFQSTL